MGTGSPVHRGRSLGFYSIALILVFAERQLPFLAYDGQWYVDIATNGYHVRALDNPNSPHPHYDFAFHPAWPLLIRIASLGGLLPAGFVAVVLANVPLGGGSGGPVPPFQ